MLCLCSTNKELRSIWSLIGHTVALLQCSPAMALLWWLFCHGSYMNPRTVKKKKAQAGGGEEPEKISLSSAFSCNRKLWEEQSRGRDPGCSSLFSHLWWQVQPALTADFSGAQRQCMTEVFQMFRGQPIPSHSCNSKSSSSLTRGMT